MTGRQRILTCMLGFDTELADGTPLHDAGAEEWHAVLGEAAAVGFDAVEIADSHIRPGDLSPSALGDLGDVARETGVDLLSLHVQRRSVIMPGLGQENLAYAHRSIDAAAELGIEVFSTGLHRPFTEAQRRSLWFWTAPGASDPDDPEIRELAVTRLRELGSHAASVGLEMSLEVYEDTYCGTADSAIALIEDIGLDNVGLNPDVGNLVRLHRPVDDWRETYRRLLPHANYWHLKNYARDEAGDGSWWTSTPSTLELGVINYRQVVRWARELGYEGHYTMEQYGGDSLGVCAVNRRYLEGLLADQANLGRISPLPEPNEKRAS
ncbi:sugar phosphate isomerase/epimerase [Leucobacter sp. CSA1]|uniref:Sugar phosphate isomerase/epimerase n=1 Tax=Leucobacter chromiisoli TaxID=2796471 RepID=A0A934Q8A7_9MICO|nr:sugar phosphate isomerase/epimerase family protein [Leucobacter chromiisoli]MBK0419558.1 sugar phosphate isomerase/epimerase [Leucobacter chromiisoli]